MTDSDSGDAIAAACKRYPAISQDVIANIVAHARQAIIAQRDAAIAERDALRADRDKWKAAHDNQRDIKRAALSRADLPIDEHPERAEFRATMRRLEDERERADQSSINLYTKLLAERKLREAAEAELAEKTRECEISDHVAKVRWEARSLAEVNQRSAEKERDEARAALAAAEKQRDRLAEALEKITSGTEAGWYMKTARDALAALKRIAVVTSSEGVPTDPKLARDIAHQEARAALASDAAAADEGEG